MSDAEAPLRRLADSTEDILFAADAAGLVTYIGPQVSRYGLSADQLIGMPFTQLLHADDVDGLTDAFRQSMVSGSNPAPRRFRLRTEGAAGRWFEEHSTLCRNEHGAPSGLVGVVRDVTEQHNAESKSEALLRSWKLVSGILAGFVNLPVTGYDDAIRGALARLARHTGAFRSVIFLVSEDGTTVSNTHEWCATPDDSQIEQLQSVPVERFTRYFETLRHGEALILESPQDLPSQCTVEQGWTTAGGFQPALFVPMHKRNAVVGALGFQGHIDEHRKWPEELVALLRFVADILVSLLDRRETEAKLIRSQYRLESAQQIGKVGSWELDLEKNRLAWTGETYRIFDVPLGATLEYDSFLDRVHPDDRTLVDAAWKAALAGEPYDIEHRLLVGDRVKWVREKAELERDESGRAIRAIGFTQDITKDKLAESERQRAEQEKLRFQERLHQTQKMEAIGVLAGGVAHDMNNILSGIMMLASLADVESESVTLASEDRDKILELCRRGRELTRSLLGFARKGKYRQAPVSLPQLVSEVVDIVARAAPKRIRFKLNLDQSVGPVEGDTDQLNSVVMNLCLNALDAIQGEGTVSVTCRRVLVAPESSEAQTELPPGRYVRVDFQDDGSGMDHETLERCREPFFTTKAPGKGTGLGLSMAHGTIQSHGGALLIESSRERGTTVSILLPEVEQRAGSSYPAPAGHAQRGLHSGTALLVDDEDLIRFAGKKMLERLGYEVLLASNGREALERCDERKGDLALVILDLVMPVMGGEDAFRALRAKYPSLKILLCSGHSREAVANDLLSSGAAGFLQKPFASRHLQEAIEAALDSTESSG